MKKLFALVICICLALGAVGCSSTTEPETQPAATTEATIPDVIIDSPTEPVLPEKLVQSMHAISLPTVTESTLADDGTELFTLSYQKAQLILNGTDVEEKIVGDLQTRMGSVLSSAPEIESLAQEDYPNSEYWSPYFINMNFTPTRIDQSVISLFGNLVTYSGGPHPFLVSESVTYDLTTGDSLTLDDILVAEFPRENLSTLIIDALSDQVDELHYDYDTVLQERFSADCGSITDWYFSRTGLCFHFSPYDIAPYSSGTIIAELPYDTLTDILQEKYFPTKVVDATGSMYAETFLDDDTERFTFTAEVELAAEESQILLYSDATVTDVRIETGSWYSDGSRYISSATVFAADTISIGNAIKLSANLSDENSILRLVYRSGDQEVSALIVYDEAGDSILLAHG